MPKLFININSKHMELSVSSAIYSKIESVAALRMISRAKLVRKFFDIYQEFDEEKMREFLID